MPPEPSAIVAPGRLAVALDATPLLGRSTGVGAFCAGALGGLAARDDLDVSAFAISWRRRMGIVAHVPPGVSTRQRAMPDRPLRVAWSHSRLPPIEWFIGPQQVVHGTNFVVPPTRRAARVVTVHDLTVVRFPEMCGPATLEYPARIRRAVADGAWVHTDSEFVAAEVIDHFGVDPGRVRSVPLGIPGLGGSRPGAELRFPLPEGTSRYVAAIGTVEPRKDYPSLVEAFTSVSRAHPEVALVIVGADGWGADRLADAIRSSPVGERIVRPGYLDDDALAVTLQRAAALAYPSVYEGFGFPPLQAMAAGVPVVATAVGAIPEVVGDGAVLVRGGDSQALAEALVHVLDGGADIEALVARGRQRAAEFSWSRCAEGLDGLYRDAWASRG
ncbi:MAG TPA: glycosyltransferase family 1 protein [Acidimicrobiales bacterium]|nr:glycosyltransferase family 1 protein [Acidimicrobiales bacterium]